MLIQIYPASEIAGGGSETPQTRRKWSSQAEHCILRAAEYELIAQNTSDQSVKQTNFELSRRWREFARQAYKFDQIERATADN